jgi:hypothetical protein
VRHEGVLLNSPVRLLVLTISVSAFACATAKAPAPAPAPTPTPTVSRDQFYEAIAGGKPPSKDLPEDEVEGATPKTEAMTVVVDPVTKKRLRKVPKGPPLYEKDGHLFSGIVSDAKGVPIVRQDADFYYLEAEPDLTPEQAAARAKAQAEAAAKESRLPPIVELPKEEAEVVKPKVSAKKIRLADSSKGLPTAGIWRENFALADVDGDGRPEIVSGPPRLSGQGLRIFRLEGDRWKSYDPQLENPENLGVGYGGVAAGPLAGSGRNDLVWGGHGGGTWAAYNLGGMKFRLERRGLPGAISTRAMAIGDLDGDGRNDVLVISDMPEFQYTGGKPRATASGYVEGYDVRAEINKPDRFVELTTGLDQPCFGYSIALFTPKDAKDGKPFYISGCRYFGGLHVLYEFDRAKSAFQVAGVETVERNSGHEGTAVGRYAGFPAAFVSYIKNTPGNAVPDIAGDGVSVYYRDGETWKRKRIFKRLGLERATSQAIAVGDLDGDGLDDVVFADDLVHRVRVFFQTKGGEFEELDESLEPTFVNSAAAARIADVDGDGRPDIVLMLHYLTGHETRSGGFRFFRNLPSP